MKIIMLRKKIFISLKIIGVLILSGCGGNNDEKQEKQNSQLDPKKEINKKYGVYEKKYSKNKNYIIETRIYKNDEPEVFLSNSSKSSVTKLTSNNFIEFSPVVNDKGDYAYAQSKYSTSASKVLLNDKIIVETDNNMFYKNLAINNNYLCFSETRFYNGDNFLNIIDIDTKVSIRKLINGYIEKMDFINENVLILQIFSLDTMSMDLLSFNIKDKKFKIISNSKGDEILNRIFEDGSFEILSFENNKSDLKLLFNAYFDYKRNQFFDPFSYGNNFMGRLSWNQSYRLEALTKLYELTKDKSIYNKIDNSINNLLDRTNENIKITNKFNHQYSYASKKYSLDKTTPISLMVQDGKIYYSILSSINKIGGELKKKYSVLIIDRFLKLFDYYEKYYSDGLYKFQKDMNFHVDGVWLPYNQQNAFALAILEIYKITNENKYKQRIYEIAKKFKTDFIYTDNKLIWHYWPSEFYKGWNKGNNLSTNTPSRKPFTDSLYEDLSHSGINVKFILEFQKQFPNEVFDEEDISNLHNTINGFIYKNSFSRFMSGDINYQSAEYRFLPSYGWSELSNKKLNAFYYNLNPNIYPDFDSQNWIKYLNGINSLENLSLSAYFLKYNNSFKLINEEFKQFNKFNIKEILDD